MLPTSSPSLIDMDVLSVAETALDVLSRAACMLEGSSSHEKGMLNVRRASTSAVFSSFLTKENLYRRQDVRMFVSLSVC